MAASPANLVGEGVKLEYSRPRHIATFVNFCRTTWLRRGARKAKKSNEKAKRGVATGVAKSIAQRVRSYIPDRPGGANLIRLIQPGNQSQAR